MDLTQPAVAQAGPAAGNESARELVIKARKGWIPVDFRELISHRELLLFLVWRDVKVKYKQAILGFAWAILVPVIQVLLFTFIGLAAGFDTKVHGSLTLTDGQVISGSIGKVKTDGHVSAYAVVTNGAPVTIPIASVVSADVPSYALYVYAGLLPWMFLSSAITNGGLSLVSQQNLLSKIYMPRMFIPMSTIGTALIDMALSAVVFVGMFAWFGFAPSSNILYLPVLLILLVTLGLGLSFMLSALTINYRYVRFLIPFLAQILMWVSAAVYPPRIFSSHQMSILDFNPVYGVICAFRWALLGEPLHGRALVVAIVFSVVVLLWGMFYFKKAERRFADIA